MIDRVNVEIPWKQLHEERHFSIPKMDLLNSLYLADDAGSSSIFLMNSRTFLIPHFKFKPVENDQVFFWVGNGPNGPDSNGTKIPNEKQRYAQQKKIPHFLLIT